MSKLSILAETLIGSEIVKLGNEINERIKKGEKIYNYTIGDFDSSIFPIPELLQQYIIEAYQNHYTSYPPADGLLELREGVSKFVKTNEKLDYAANEILIAAGGRPLIYATFKTIVDAGDKVIYAVPSWNNNHYVHLTNGAHCLIEALPENNFMPLASDVEKCIEGATLLCLCSPQNPTGTTLQKSELEKICELVVAENNKRGEGEKKLYVMYDQMYWTLTYGDTKHYDPVSVNPAMRDYTIYISGISKMFAATGVRVGWSFGPAHVIAKMKSLLSHVGAWAPMAEQKAVARYMVEQESIEAYFTKFKQRLENRLQKLYAGFINLKNKGFNVDAIAPQAAIYLTIKIDLAGKQKADGTALATQADVTQYLLSEAGLAIVPFYAFGADRNSAWYRLSIGTCKTSEIDEMFGKLEAALSKLS